MSRSLSFYIKESVQALKKFAESIASLEADFLQMKALSQRVESRTFPIPDAIARKVEFNQSLKLSLPDLGLRTHERLTQSQQRALEDFRTAGRALGYESEVKFLPNLGNAVVIEFSNPREREKVPVKKGAKK